MKKTIYIIPGLGESNRLIRYQKLAAELQGKGCVIKKIDPDWQKPLSEQIIKVEKNAVVIGFSLGAVLAYLIAEKFPCKKVIFASMSPIHTFKTKSSIKSLNTIMPLEKASAIVKDWKNIKVSLSNFKTPFVRLVGEYEKGMGTADVYVPNAGHYLGKKYREEILKFV
jgi:esterase/lipase